MPVLPKRRKKNHKYSSVWWCTPIIPALGKLRQENLEFEVQYRLYNKTLSGKKRERKRGREERGRRERERNSFLGT
jgi:hypothetical protein